MEKYNYYEAVADDIREYIRDNINLEDYTENRDELEEVLNDDLWVADSVTGNASGSYFCNAWKAEECLCHNTDLLRDALDEFCCEYSDAVKKGAEWCDVTIRCYILGGCIGTVLDELEGSGELTV